MLALAACSSVPDEINPVSWYDSIAGDEDVAEAEPAPGAEEEFPTLSSVPDEPAQTQSTDEYAAVAEGLQADKANAQYTNESIRRADDEVEGTTPIVAAAPEPEPQVVQPEPEPEPAFEPEPVAAAEPVVAPEPVVVAETQTQAATAVPAQTAQAEDYSQYATVAEGLRAHSGSAPLPATSPVATATTTTTTTVAATTSAASTTATTTAATTAQVQPVEQAVEPVPAQPLQPVQQTAAVAEPVPAQPLPGTTVAATAATAQASVPAATTTTTTTAGTTAATAPAAAQGSFMDMFNAAYQASAARTLSGSATTTAATAVPAVAQPTAATALPASYAPTARYHGVRPTRLIASVMFADGSARLDAQARKTLLEVAYAYGATGGQILLVGHASGSGGSNAELANFDVSLKRAVAVANELMRLQVTPENILVEAVGDNMPQVSLDMAGGAVNRRVDIYLGN